MIISRFFFLFLLRLQTKTTVHIWSFFQIKGIVPDAIMQLIRPLKTLWNLPNFILSEIPSTSGAEKDLRECIALNINSMQISENEMPIHQNQLVPDQYPSQTKPKFRHGNVVVKLMSRNFLVVLSCNSDLIVWKNLNFKKFQVPFRCLQDKRSLHDNGSYKNQRNIGDRGFSDFVL